MDDKKQGPTGETTSRRTKPKNGTKAVCLAILMCLALYRWQAFPTKHCQQRFKYAGESIDWEPCGDIDNHQLECSAIDVPMDQFDSENSGDKTFNIPLIRLRGHNATKNLLINPGGPGGSGMGFLYRRGKQLNTLVGEEFHVMSFDPRGVNSSTPTGVCYPDQETRNKRSPVHDKDIMADSSELYAWSANYVKACSDTAGEHGKYLNTPQTAADMNSILDAVGQDNLIYWGFSYGTTLGQTYASLFPDRAERVIIDGVSNQHDWYNSLVDEEHLIDTENVLYGFFDECIKASSNCSLAKLADSTEELQDLVFNFSEKLKTDPISVYVNNTVYGVLDYRSLWQNGIFPILYRPAEWFDLADRLAKLLQGNATDAFLAYGGGREQPSSKYEDANSVIYLNDARTGPKYWPHERNKVLDEVSHFFNSSVFAPFEASDFYIKSQWLIPKTHTFSPSKSVKTLHPLLIMSNTYDPVCPLVSAESARDMFEGSRLVEVKGYGHCTIALTSMCAARHVRDFLSTGKLPENDTQCEVDGSYFIRPEEKSVEASWLGFQSEDLRIHEAQVALAQDLEWPAVRFL